MRGAATRQVHESCGRRCCCVRTRVRRNRGRGTTRSRLSECMVKQHAGTRHTNSARMHTHTHTHMQTHTRTHAVQKSTQSRHSTAPALYVMLHSRGLFSKTLGSGNSSSPANQRLVLISRPSGLTCETTQTFVLDACLHNILKTCQHKGRHIHLVLWA